MEQPGVTYDPITGEIIVRGKGTKADLSTTSGEVVKMKDGSHQEVNINHPGDANTHVNIGSATMDTAHSVMNVDILNLQPLPRQ